MAFSNVGTTAWARRTNGRLSRLDRIELLRQGIVLQLKLMPVKLQRRFGLSPKRLAHVDLARIRIPDSVVSRRAEEMLQELCPGHLVNHCYRSYLWGAVLAHLDNIGYDPEFLYVACLLHDTGLADQRSAIYQQSHCFALDGAMLAADLALDNGWSQRRSDRLAEAISLHLNPIVDLSHGAEAHLLNAGAALDVAGLRKWEVSLATVDEVLTRYPRLRFKEELDTLMRNQAASKPCCRMHFFYDKLDFGKVIRRASFKE